MFNIFDIIVQWFHIMVPVLIISLVFGVGMVLFRMIREALNR